MDVRSWRVFLDSSVLVSGIISQTGASSAILDLGEAAEIIIVLSKGVLVETDRVFEKKFPGLVVEFREFIRNLSPIVTADPTVQEIREAESVIDKDDAPILAAAKKVNIHYLVSLDTRHFHSSKVCQYLNSPIVTPAQFLTGFRNIFEKEG
ncbi:MAG: putative toxin-antitoxin system toxin component, PIN family [Omnitrophica WOR_2 bacterium RIFCSPHIGHO2_02_FULL_50_17]|nr:MAG: putative toxin-antitoxin system toxin component, PIN family [Omnitrophica WOR_2 bacterium RIFCSPHIGHO2_02_FULL_50_17]